MKRIIRLTERDLTRLVKRTITELDKSTYDSAADVASEKGFNKLSDKFREHGRNPMHNEKNNIVMVIKQESGYEYPFYLRVDSLIKEFNDDSGTYLMETESLNPDDKIFKVKKKFELTLSSNKIEFYQNGQFPSLPKTRKDAIKVLKMFEGKGVDVSDIDPRSISYDDSGF
jgi:hypothetical protein